MKQEPYVFDFDKEVELARAAFPDMAEKTTFIDVTHPEARKQIRDWLEQHDPPPTVDSKFAGAAPEKQLQEKSDNLSRTPGMALQMLTGAALLLCGSGKGPQHVPCFKDNNKERFFIFQHELGHLVVPGGMGLGEKPRSHDPHDIMAHTKNFEDRADSFAAFTGLNRGIFNRLAILALAVYRTCEALRSNSCSHMTTGKWQLVV